MKYVFFERSFGLCSLLAILIALIGILGLILFTTGSIDCPGGFLGGFLTHR